MKKKLLCFGLALSMALSMPVFKADASAKQSLRSPSEAAQYALNRSGRQMYNYYGVGGWCAAFVCDALGVYNTSYSSTSVTELVKRCVDGESNKLGDFYLVADNKNDWEVYDSGRFVRGVSNIAKCYDPYFTPRVGDLVVYEENAWCYNDQYEDYVNYIYDGPEHIAIVVEVSGEGRDAKIKTVEGNYTELSQKPWDYDSYFDYIWGYHNASEQNKINKSVKVVEMSDSRSWQIYGYIRPDYADAASTPKFLEGDVNLNGTVSAADFVYLQKYILCCINLSADQMRNADMNRDGRVDLSDLLKLRIKLLE